MSRIPGGGVDAICVFFECSDASGTVECPELDCIIPRGSDEGVTTSGIVINGVDFAGVFLKGAERILGWGKSCVEKLNGAVSDSGD